MQATHNQCAQDLFDVQTTIALLRRTLEHSKHKVRNTGVVEQQTVQAQLKNGQDIHSKALDQAQNNVAQIVCLQNIVAQLQEKLALQQGGCAVTPTKISVKSDHQNGSDSEGYDNVQEC